MNSAFELYMITLLIYFGVDLMACWGLDLQFGTTGVLNFSFIIFQAAGAYTAGILTLGPSSANGAFQTYIGGASLPFPIPILAAMLVGAGLSVVVGLIGIRKLRSDYEAMVMLVISVIATTVATSQVALVNGPAGLSLIPQPLHGAFGLSDISYGWAYVGFVAILCAGVCFMMVRIGKSPLGRALRAVRDNEDAAAALGRNVSRLRLLVFVIGGTVAALSGAVLVEFIGAWAPSGWLYPETFVLFTAVIVGGRANVLGVAIGALIIPVGLQQAVDYLPISIDPLVISSLEWIITGLITMAFIWFRPQGLFPEKKRRFAKPPARDQLSGTHDAIPGEWSHRASKA